LTTQILFQLKRKIFVKAGTFRDAAMCTPFSLVFYSNAASKCAAPANNSPLQEKSVVNVTIMPKDHASEMYSGDTM